MSRADRPTRRDFLQWGTAASGAFLTGGLPVWAAAAEEPAKPQPQPLPTQKWGKLDHRVAMLWLGTAHIHRGKSLDEAAALVQDALDKGITQIDTARSYGSEDAIGRAIRGRRDQLTLLTKTTDRSYDGAMRELEQSLKALGTDHVDVWKVHSIGYRHDGEQEIENLRNRNGVMKAMRKAKAEGLTKYIGFTGHTDPAYMVKVMEWDTDGEFDTLLYAISAATWRNQPGWEEQVTPLAREKNYGLMGMKVLNAGSAVGVGGRRASVQELAAYVYDLNLPTITLGLYKRAEVDTAIAACRAYAAKREQKSEHSAARERSRAALHAKLAGLDLPYQRPGYVDGRVAVG
jgi:uncharacterized protein